MTATAAPSEPIGPRRLRRRILLLAVMPLLAAVAVIALAVRSQAQDLALQERALVETAYLASKEAELRHHVEMAMNMIRPLYDSGRDDEATRQEAIRILNAFDYDNGDGYFFAYDYSGRCLVLPHQPELVGQNLWDIRDRDGQPVVQALIAKAREGEGYFRYVWNKPSAREVAPKLGYVVGLQRWGWMVGTGIYLDDVQATLDALERQGRANIDKTTGWIAIIAITYGSVIYFADTRMKTKDNSFAGFPACWNMVILVLFALKPNFWIILIVVVALTYTMFTNIKFIHPVRTVRWRAVSLPVTVAWVVFAVWAVLVDFHPESFARWGLLLTSLWLTFAGLAQQLTERRA